MGYKGGAAKGPPVGRRGSTQSAEVKRERERPRMSTTFLPLYMDPAAKITPAERWIELPDDQITISLVNEILSLITDDLWVAAACADRVVDDVDVQRSVIEAGLSRTEGAVKEVQKVLEVTKVEAEDETLGDDVQSKLEFDDGARELVALRRFLRQRAYLVETYTLMAEDGEWKLSTHRQEVAERSPEINDLEEELDDLDLDPWADTEEETSTADSKPDSGATSIRQAPPVSLSKFLLSPLLETALLLATLPQISPLNTLFSRHSSQLFPHRYDILSAIPLHIPAETLSPILPTFDFASSAEKAPIKLSIRDTPDWTESLEAAHFMKAAPLSIPIPLVDLQLEEPAIPHLRSAEELSAWYVDRVAKIDSSVGLVDVALSFVQHGASQGIPGLDALGEELSLLSRLVYDTGSNERPAANADWTLDRWRRMDTSTIVSSYLSLSTPETVAADIRKLVLPYLYVLEAREERAGHPDSSIPTRYLYTYILSAPLPIVAAIFEASKPTLPVAQRLITKDEDLARLALACLYGSDSLDEWGTMSQIFECLPEWASEAGSDDEVESEAADMTLGSMASFVAPSASRAKVTPQDLMLFFNPLPQRSLSRALDILDIHLESGEILSRWDVAAPLRWLLQSANDEAQQKAWATRMARRNVEGDEIESQEEWVALMKDMIKLAGGKEGLMRGAFGRLSKDQVKRIFFEGLLSLGKFKLAKRMMQPKRDKTPLSADVVEDICLTVSREYYDNAQSGNLHVGEMKSAFECLAVAPPTPAITSEREFIEATSKICSYGVESRPGVPLAPIEIRLTKDRLSLIARVLSSNDDLYKHSEVVLDIVRKLGFKDDVPAEVKTLAMLADAATQAEDFNRAAETCERMVTAVQDLRQAARASSDSLPDEAEAKASEEAVEVCWHTCFQLGRQPEFDDSKRKLTLLAQAMRLCPSENVLDVLAVWRRVEGDVLREHPLGSTERDRSAKPVGSRAGTGVAALSARLPSLSAHLLSMPNTPALPITSDAAAAMASRTFDRMASVAAHLPSNLPFSLRGRSQLSEPDRSGSPASDVSHQAKAAFARGVGWLIGADED